MSWNYSGDPAASPLDRVRFICGDTNEAEPILQDEEFNFLIAEYGHNENLLLYHIFITVATVFSRDIVRRLGPQSEDPTARLTFFKEQAAYYKQRMSSAGLSLPKYAYPKVFHKGMQNNPPWSPSDRRDSLV